MNVRRVIPLAALLALTLHAIDGPCGTTLLYVDGMDFGASVKGLAITQEPRKTAYLEGSYLGKAIAIQGSVKAKTIAWNGDVCDCVALKGVVADVQLAIIEAQRRGDDVDLVTHSMGTVVGYLALENLAAPRPQSPYKGIRHFVTLSSPLSSRA